MSEIKYSEEDYDETWKILHSTYQASEESGYDFKTVTNYFREWADEIIDTEGHENCLPLL